MFNIVKCKDYGDKTVSKALKELVDLSKFVKKGDKVLLKPNLLFAAEPEKNITTHPSIVKAVVKELNKLGASVIIADSPGGSFTKKGLDSLYKITGMEKLSKEVKCKLNYDTNHYTLSNKDGFLKKYKLLSVLKKVDKVINLPKVKTHMLCTLTCATKNLFGLIPGGDKVSYYARFKQVDDFNKMLVELAELTKPVLNIVDGVIGMEGQGPSNGKPKKLGVLVAGDNCFEVDYHVSKMIGLDLNSVNYLSIALKKNLFVKSKFDISKFSVVFKKAHSGFLSRFYNFLPGFLKNIVSNYWLEVPVINSKCIGCGDCMRSCPTKAIKIFNKKSVIDYNKCIRCYCCHELCKFKSVDLKKKLF